MGVTITSVLLSDANEEYTGKLPSGVYIEWYGHMPSVAGVSVNVSWDTTADGKTPDRVYFVWKIREGHIHGSGSTNASGQAYQGISGTSGSTTIVKNIDFREVSTPSGITDYYFEFYLGLRWTDGTTKSYTEEKTYVDIYYREYTPLSIPAFSASRCTAEGVTDESGTRAKIAATYAVSPIGDNNTKALVVKYREAGEEDWDQETINISALDYSDSVPETVLAATFAADKTYEVRAELTDLLNTTTNDKTLAPAFALVHYHADKAHVAFGKYAESDGPGFDVALDARFRDAAQFDVAPTIPAEAERAALLAHLTPYCKLSNPVSETVTRNASYYFWAFDFQVSANPGGYTIFEGGASGTRKMGWEIPTDGIYRVTMTAKFNSGSTASAIVIGIARMTSDWSPPAANYMTEAALMSAATELKEQHVLSWLAAITNGQFVCEMECEVGEKIWPTALLVTASKTIDVDNTWCSIQRIG